MAEQKSKKVKYSVVVNTWCKNCGICIAFCPKGVFESDEFGRPIVKYEENCINCKLCVVRCPDFAVDVSEK